MNPPDMLPGDDEPPPAGIPSAKRILATLKPGHPRIIATEADFERIRGLVKSDELAGKWYARIKGLADKCLFEPPAEYEIPDGVRLLTVSRKVLSRICILALVFRVDRERRFAERAIEEMLNAADFADWNPPHFLDTAEMTHALATGYDWLYDELTQEQRDTIREAIIDKGLKPALEAYEAHAEEREGLFWPAATHNWNQVCNGGIGIGALAIADEEPALAGTLLRHGLSRVPAAMAHYAPKGGYPEGPMYWKYGTRYNIYLIAALESALGTDFGLHRAAGFDETGLFTIHMLGPSGKVFNFADAPPGRVADPGMFWLANRFDHPEYAEYQTKYTPGEPLDLVWYRPPQNVAQASSLCSGATGKMPVPRGETRGETGKMPVPRGGIRKLSLDSYFPYVEVATMRSSWDEDALFVAFKAGNNQFNHGNLDMGTFVLDALGERWAMDPGRESYSVPGYWDRSANGTRWQYYRERVEGHNTLVINPDDRPDQDPMAMAEINVAQASSLCPTVTADLTPAYARHVSSFKRTVSLTDERRAVEVHDSVVAHDSSEIWWFMHTEADVKVVEGGRSAELSLNGKQLTVRLVEPDDAAFTVMPAAPLPTSPNPAGQDPNEGIRKLAIHCENIEDLELTVRFDPEWE